ncbi:MAG: inositol 2-dehydrogenase [Ectothiorhodospiraceae bacterium AqS1]|nr:inositol 2-dehydrogenase [Ectothiorhodospiraceae bacterium AqS1]
MLKIALLGCGRIGKMHAFNIVAHPRAQLAAVYDSHTPAAEEVAAAYQVRLAKTPEEIFTADDVDAVLIASATPTHADYIEAAVAANKPALCEKPIDLTLARVNACAEKVKDKGVPIQIGLNRRFDPGHRAARNAVAAGEIGELHQVIITSRDPKMPPRDYCEQAGGVFRDMVIHDFDLARFMLSEEPVNVFAVGGRLVAPDLMNELDDYDTTMVIMTTASGKQCHINTSRTSTFGYDQRVELLGKTGMVQSLNRRPIEVRKYGAERVESAEPYLPFYIERYREAFDAEIESFVDSIENGTPVEADFEDGRRALILAEAATRSADEGRLVSVDEFL